MNHWEWIPGTFERYQVSRDGRVRSFYHRHGRRKTPHILVPSIGSHKYKVVTLRINGNPEVHAIHRIVLMTFVGKPKPGEECRHLDGDRMNNRLSNLQWGSRSENMQDRVRHRVEAAQETK